MSKNREIPLDEIELLRVQLFNERVVSSRESANSAQLVQQVRQAELASLISALTEKYKVEAEGLEYRGVDVQKKVLVFGPKIETPTEGSE